MAWQARTCKHVLVEQHGMVATENPTIFCACGRSVHADVCVDLTPLPIGVRKALGLHRVDYLCDGCQTRLFRELHISEEEFYQLLGAPEEALVLHRSRDPLHAVGCDLRPEPYRPRHEIVGKARMVGKRLSEIQVAAPIPLRFKLRSHEDAAVAVHLDTTNGIELIGLPDAAGRVSPGSPEGALPDPAATSAIDSISSDDPAADEPLPAGVRIPY